MAVRLLIASVAIGIMVTISGCDKNKSKETNSVEYKSYTASDNAFTVELPTRYSVEIRDEQIRNSSGIITHHKLYLWSNGDDVAFQVAVSPASNLDIDEAEAVDFMTRMIQKTMARMNTTLVSITDVSRPSGKARRAIGKGTHNGHRYQIAIEVQIVGDRCFAAMAMGGAMDSDARKYEPWTDRFFDTFRPEATAASVSHEPIHAKPEVRLTQVPLDAQKLLIVDVTENIKMKLILVKPGTFMMGAASNEEGSYSYERPQHRVTITKPFYIGMYEVTQEEYQAVSGTEGTPPESAQHPQTMSWREAVDFCAKLSQKTGKRFRLPTEAEWEYACRAGTTTRYYFGDSRDQLYQYAWSGKNSESSLHPVGQKLPNDWGLYDMHGNACEWCSDWYSPYSLRHATDPLGPSKGYMRVDPSRPYMRISRSGNYICYPNDCRSAKRYKFDPDYSGASTGLRVVCDIE